MEDKTPVFMDELVKLLVEATQSPTGVPASLIREKEIELAKKKQIVKEAQELSERLKNFSQKNENISADVRRPAKEFRSRSPNRSRSP